jgi:predicted HicB family RNase H-like nuclease
VIEYKGYTGVFEFDPSVDAFHGRVVGMRDVVTFEGRSLDELRREMAESVEDYLELCSEAGRDPERPYRGSFLVRTTPELHRAAAIRAEASGMSLNAWMESTIAQVVREPSPPSAPSESEAARGRSLSPRAKTPAARGRPR